MFKLTMLKLHLKLQSYKINKRRVNLECYTNYDNLSIAIDDIVFFS